MKNFFTAKEAIEYIAQNPDRHSKLVIPEIEGVMRKYASLEVEGVSTICFLLENGKINSHPYLDVEGFMLVPCNTWRAAHALEFRSYENVQPIDSYRPNIAKPKNVLKGTRKSLTAWVEYWKSYNANLREYCIRELERRERAVPRARRALLDAGFKPFRSYETAEEATQFECTRGGVVCRADISAQGVVFTQYAISHIEASKLFQDIKDINHNN